MTSFQKHEYLLALAAPEDMPAIDVATVVTIRSAQPREQTWAAFKSAVTEWVNTTESGGAYREDEDMNIGAFMCSDAVNNAPFKGIAFTHGIIVLEARQLNAERIQSYYEPLVNHQP